MKYLINLTIFCSSLLNGFGQSETLIPQEAVSVVSINNISLLQKISLDDLVNYEFMEELQQELFDGSTDGKSIKDCGIDFDQRMNIFVGNAVDYEVGGVTFGISNQAKFFEVFDDYDKVPCDYPGVELYSSYFNRIAIKGNYGVLLRVNPMMEFVDMLTDSIWYARGNEYPWGYGYDEIYNDLDGENIEEAFELMEELETIENTNNPSADDTFPIATNDPTQKTYFELRDSVEMSLQNEYMQQVSKNIFVDKKCLFYADEEFRTLVSHSSDASIYLDNSRYFMQGSSIWYFQAMYPQLYKELGELYESNVIIGDIQIKDNTVEFLVTSKYNEKLGSIYEEMNSAKFDKNVLKYIHQDNSAFFTYNVNLLGAYEQSMDVIVPILEKETSSKVTANLLVLELMDALIDKNTVFNTYRGSMFGTYNGVETIKAKKIIFEYDDETFEYIERQVETEEEMPIFLIGYSTKREDIIRKVMKRLDRLSDKVIAYNDYWIIHDAILNAAPAYVFMNNGLFMITNDKNIPTNYFHGYGSNALSKKNAKKAKKSATIYAFADMEKAVENLPSSLFDGRQNEMLDFIRGKSGNIEITSGGAKEFSSDFKLVYNLNGEQDDSGTYILDLINSIYVFTK